MMETLGRKLGTKQAVVAGEATAADLVAINACCALRPLGPEDVAVFSCAVCNDQVDRDQERFDQLVLADFAETLPGKSLLVGHDWGPPGVGRFYAAALEHVGSVLVLQGKFYMLRATEGQLIQKITAGVVWAVSVGFFCPSVEEQVDPRTGALQLRTYTRGPNGEHAEAIEASLVFLGAQFGAQITKAAGRKSDCCPSCRTAKEPCQGKRTALEQELGAVDQLLAELREPAGVFGSKAPRPAGDVLELGDRRRRLVEELWR